MYAVLPEARRGQQIPLELELPVVVSHQPVLLTTQSPLAPLPNSLSLGLSLVLEVSDCVRPAGSSAPVWDYGPNHVVSFRSETQVLMFVWGAIYPLAEPSPVPPSLDFNVHSEGASWPPAGSNWEDDDTCN